MNIISTSCTSSYHKILQYNYSNRNLRWYKMIIVIKPTTHLHRTIHLIPQTLRDVHHKFNILETNMISLREYKICWGDVGYQEHKPTTVFQEYRRPTEYYTRKRKMLFFIHKCSMKIHIPNIYQRKAAYPIYISTGISNTINCLSRTHSSIQAAHCYTKHHR